jgi:hypothetical protein
VDIRAIQSKQVRDATEEVVDVIQRALSRSERGPVYTAVLDTATGEVFGGLNLGSRGHPPTAAEIQHLTENLHPILQSRLESLRSSLQQMVEAGTITEEQLRAGVAGAHSEIVALNNAVRAREAALGVSISEQDLGSFLVHNRELTSSATSPDFGQGVPPPCVNCSYLIRGAQIVP